MKGFTKLDNATDMTALLDLPGALPRVALVFLQARNLPDATCVMRCGRVMDELRLSEPTVRRALADLSARGLVVNLGDGVYTAAGSRAAKKFVKANTRSDKEVSSPVNQKFVSSDKTSLSNMIPPAHKDAVSDAPAVTPKEVELKLKEVEQLLTTTPTPPTPPQAGGALEGVQGLKDQLPPTAEPEALDQPSPEPQPGPVGAAEPRQRPAKRSAARPAAADKLPPLPPELTEAWPELPGAWAAWLEHRHALHRPFTPQSAREQLRQLAESPDPVRLIRHSLAHSWRGLFEPDVDRPGRPAARVDVSNRQNWTREEWLS